MQYKEDLRIIRTRKLLYTTLLDMMEELSIEKISVINLCSRAMVNRATFYAHFEDKYHLLTFALDELKDKVYANFTRDLKFDSPSEILKNILVMATEFICDKHNNIFNVIKNNRNEKVINTITESLSQSIKYQLSKFKDSHSFSVPLPLLSIFIAGGMMNMTMWYLDNSDKCNVDELKDYISSLSDKFDFFEVKA